MTTYRDAKGRFRRKTREDMSEGESALADITQRYYQSLSRQEAQWRTISRDQYGVHLGALNPGNLTLYRPLEDDCAVDSSKPRQPSSPDSENSYAYNQISLYIRVYAVRVGITRRLRALA